jgi:hypothetical protein
MTGAASRLSESAIRKRLLAIAGVVVVALISLVAVGPIEQDQAYHCFADQRAFFGIPHTCDVLSNVAFLITGAFGLWTVGSRRAVVLEPWETVAWSIVFFGVVATSLGSAWYHVTPNDASLAWDRLPMTIAFAGITSVLLGARVSRRAGRAALAPMLIVGMGSIAVWRWTGDLRLYAAVQFVPLLAIGLLLLLVPGRYDRSRELWIAFAWYAAAKALEASDELVYELTGFVSGHTLKHICAALAPVWFALYLIRRRPTQAGATQAGATQAGEAPA